MEKIKGAKWGKPQKKISKKDTLVFFEPPNPEFFEKTSPWILNRCASTFIVNINDADIDVDILNPN